MEAYEDEHGQEGFLLSTGRTFYAHGSTLGMGPHGGIGEGWDGALDIEEDLTPVERLEIAHYMIACWLHWGEQAFLPPEETTPDDDEPAFSFASHSWVELAEHGWAAVVARKGPLTDYKHLIGQMLEIGEYRYRCKGVVVLASMLARSGDKIGLLIEGAPQEE